MKRSAASIIRTANAAIEAANNNENAILEIYGKALKELEEIGRETYIRTPRNITVLGRLKKDFSLRIYVNGRMAFKSFGGKVFLSYSNHIDALEAVRRIRAYAN